MRRVVMKKVSVLIKEAVEKAFVSFGYDKKYGMVGISNRPDLCQYQCNGAMAAVKEYKKAPLDIANEVADKLRLSEEGNIFEKIEAVKPGFINLTLKDEFLADYVNEMGETERFGHEKEGKPRKIVIDYGGPNVAKPLHIGHLRSAIIGESIKRIERFVGNEVIGVVSLMADIESVYQDVNGITRIFIIGTVLSILITTIIGFVASKTVTSSIEKMSSQVKKMASGNYGTVVGIDTNDEIGDLAKVFNKISKRIEEEQAVTETERRKLATIIESMMDGIITTDNNGRIILINTSAEDMIGARDEEIFIGKDALKILNITEYEHIGDIIEAEDSLLVNTSKTDESLLLRAEFSKIVKEEKEDLTQMSTELEGYIIVLYDVTDQERQEKERREFVSTVSHELRTPLTTMNSYIEALEEGVINDKELAPQFIDTIHKETNRMIRMVNELMQLGKMDIKEEHYEKEFIDINKLIEQISNRFELTHPEKNFIKHTSKTPIFVEGDQDKLTQVFDNIMNNAIKYSPNGKNITIRVRQNYNHNRVNISIKDEGVGIPLVHIDKIFNRFYRVDKSRQRSMGGTGLGLALAKNIIEAHKGRIWAQSREGYGTIIFVTLPCERIDDEWL